MWDDLQGHLKFFFYGYKLRKVENDYRRKGIRYGRVLPPIKETQRNTPYAKWIRYLKNKKLFVEYQKDIMFIKFRSPFSSFNATDMILNCYTEHQVKEVIHYIDKWYSEFHGYQVNRWQQVYDDYCFEINHTEINKVMARRLYHMDAPKVKHSKYVGSSYLKKSLWDTIVDKIFLIKHE